MSNPPEPPIIVLVRPQLSENIGATARAMTNFGARMLKLVNPYPYDKVHAARMACAGREILEQAEVFPDLYSALADCTWSIATSRRLRRVKIPPLEPKTAIAKCLTLPAKAKTALVFGGEQAGLTNEELFLCDTASTIPTSKNGSLNLSQSVLVFLYEWFLAGRITPVELQNHPWTRLATHSEKQRSYDLMYKLLIASDYKPVSRLPEFMRRVKLLFEDRPLTFREQKILLKVLRYFEKLLPQLKPTMELKNPVPD